MCRLGSSVMPVPAQQTPQPSERSRISGDVVTSSQWIHNEHVSGHSGTAYLGVIMRRSILDDRVWTWQLWSCATPGNADAQPVAVGVADSQECAANECDRTAATFGGYDR